jgi:putative transposase
VISAKDHFEHPTTRVNQLWQTDFTYLKVIDWGWYYLLTVLDDYSLYIAWDLCQSMKAEDVKKTLEHAIARTGIKHVQVYHRPRLLSDNVPCFISSELKDYLSQHDMKHIRFTKFNFFHSHQSGRWRRYLSLQAVSDYTRKILLFHKIESSLRVSGIKDS